MLYVNISQVFAIWFVPFHRSPVTLTTQLQLVRRSSSKRYYISSQNDLYQVDQFVKFFAPWGIRHSIVLLWHFWATLMCMILAWLGQPFTTLLQTRADQRNKTHTNGDVAYQTNRTKALRSAVQTNGERGSQTQAVMIDKQS